MPRVFPGILFALVWSAFASAAPPTVKFAQAEIKGEVGDWIVVKADVVGGKGQTKFVVPKGLNPFPAELLKDNAPLVFSPKIEGTFTILAYAGNEDGASDLASCTVTIGKGTSPQPNPVDPTPTAKKVVVVVVEESSTRTVATAKVLNDIRLWAKANGNSYEYVEASDPAVKANGYDGYVTQTGLPTVLVFNAEATGVSKPLTSFKLSDKASFDAEIKKVLK